LKEPDIKSFTDNYFFQLGAKKFEDVPGVIKYEIPIENRDVINASTIKITFDSSIVEQHEGVELITPGSVLLDNIIEQASRRGIYDSVVLSYNEILKADEVITLNLKFKGREIKVISVNDLQVPYFLFTFKVSLVSDEKTEFLVQVLISSRTLREHPVKDLYLEEHLPNPDKMPIINKNLSDIYVAACEYLEKRVAHSVSIFRDTAQRNLKEEVNRITDYFTKLIKEARESKYPPRAAQLVQTLESERQKRLEEVRLKYRINSKVHLTSIRSIVIPTVSMIVRFVGSARSRDIELDYDSISLRIPPPLCEACSSEVTEFTLCDYGHIACSNCISMCSFCNRVSCLACDEIIQIMSKCDNCGRMMCSKHTIKDEFGLGVYCQDDILECPICGKDASRAFTSKCKKCNQKYCFLCVSSRDAICKTCRNLSTIVQSDDDVLSVKSQSALVGKLGKWKKGNNNKFVIVEGKSLLMKRTFVLDKNGTLLWEG